MAKIYCIKSKKLLADLPSEVTPRSVSVIAPGPIGEVDSGLWHIGPRDYDKYKSIIDQSGLAWVDFDDEYSYGMVF